jgi:N-sulfoglucosamine sulfohydrolase
MNRFIVQIPALSRILATVMLALLPAAVPAAQTAQRPNVLLITVDDMGWDTPGCFGGTVEDISPNIDRLASEGMRFENGHVTVAVCQPSRQTLMTGRYPHRFGALGFSPISEEITTLQEVLDKAGYINGILGKAIHLQPTHKYKWSYYKIRKEMGYGRDAEQYYKDCVAFIEMADDAGKPFYLMANSHDPHRPFHGSANDLDNVKMPSRTYTEDEVVIPGFLPELPGIRKEMTQYFSSCKRADDTVGAILRALEDTGHAENTLVMFLSDNGMPIATAKWNAYVQSTKTPWIVRWPGKIKPGTVDSEHFISGIDYMPTILDALGLEGPAGMDGSSFLPVLLGKKQGGRDQVVTCHYQWIHYYGNKQQRKEILDRMVKEKGWSYKDEYGGLIKNMNIRCIQDDRYAYLFNPWSNGKDEYLYGYELTAGALRSAAQTDPEIKARFDMIRFRTPEELYDLKKDPDSLNNLIDDPGHEQTLQRMRTGMLKWMKDKADPALPAFQEQTGL